MTKQNQNRDRDDEITCRPTYYSQSSPTSISKNPRLHYELIMHTCFSIYLIKDANHIFEINWIFFWVKTRQVEPPKWLSSTPLARRIAWVAHLPQGVEFVPFPGQTRIPSWWKRTWKMEDHIRKDQELFLQYKASIPLVWPIAKRSPPFIQIHKQTFRLLWSVPI